MAGLLPVGSALLRLQTIKIPQGLLREVLSLLVLVCVHLA